LAGSEAWATRLGLEIVAALLTMAVSGLDHLLQQAARVASATFGKNDMSDRETRIAALRLACIGEASASGLETLAYLLFMANTELESAK
jgi:hypothetical protein